MFGKEKHIQSSEAGHEVTENKHINISSETQKNREIHEDCAMSVTNEKFFDCNLLEASV
jgi:hypothetical protein